MKIVVSLGESNFITQSSNPNHFSYDDDQDGHNDVDINGDNIQIVRNAESHTTRIYLGEISYIEVENEQGIARFNLKDVAINKNNDYIYIVYKIDDESKEIRINYLGDK